MPTSNTPVNSFAEARGHVVIAQTYIGAGGGWSYAEAIAHLAKALEFILDQIEPQPRPDPIEILPPRKIADEQHDGHREVGRHG